ncbi:hypothetical protein M8J76_008152 [Diaphorina citri]|nr:hypothetical protein M8J76_008152 [Diaphorina citri]
MSHFPEFVDRPTFFRSTSLGFVKALAAIILEIWERQKAVLLDMSVRSSLSKLAYCIIFNEVKGRGHRDLRYRESDVQ